MQDAAADSTRPGYQGRSLAWDPLREDIIALLRQSRHDSIQPIYYGSNHCFLVSLSDQCAGESLAVYKPARGEYPLHDFPSGTLYRREVGSWLLNRLLGWNLVPPTVVTSGQYGVGSLQLFIEARSEGQIAMDDLSRLALLDVLLNNADRKAEHVLLGDDDRLWAIDHGLTFHVHPKLRTVLWHFSGGALPADACQDLRRLLGDLRGGRREEAQQLRDLIAPAEWRALLERLDRLLHTGKYPDPRYKPVPYRW
jgi:hypothetical protein